MLLRYFLACFFIFSTAQSFTEITSLHEVLGCIEDETTLLVLDIDNSLIRFEGFLGTSWWRSFACQFIKSYLPTEIDERIVTNIINKCSRRLTASAIQKNRVSLLERQHALRFFSLLKERNIKTLLLSARQPHSVINIKAHLRTCHVERYLMKYCPFLDTHRSPDLLNTEDIYYEPGLLLTGLSSLL